MDGGNHGWIHRVHHQEDGVPFKRKKDGGGYVTRNEPILASLCMRHPCGNEELTNAKHGI